MIQAVVSINLVFIENKPHLNGFCIESPPSATKKQK